MCWTPALVVFREEFSGFFRFPSNVRYVHHRRRWSARNTLTHVHRSVANRLRGLLGIVTRPLLRDFSSTPPVSHTLPVIAAAAFEGYVYPRGRRRSSRAKSAGTPSLLTCTHVPGAHNNTRL